MDCKIEIIPRLLHFKQPAGTSRGVYTTRKVWYLHLTSPDYPGRTGIGECAPLPALSCDDLPDYEDILAGACRRLEQCGGELDADALRDYPSILFGLETALRHLLTGSWALYDTDFSQGKAGIPINGLIWMGNFDTMLSRIEEKMAAGFRCIKLKIGAIGFEDELALLRHIRAHFSSREIELRVDANGAFSPADAMEKLKRLSELELHSIEQPIRAGQWEEMARLAADSPLPIAWMKTDRLQYAGREAEAAFGNQSAVYCSQTFPARRDMRWQRVDCRSGKTAYRLVDYFGSGVEYRPECNSQWCATFDNPLPQGLGTGLLFTDNVEMPLEVRKDCLWFCNDDI